MKIRPKQTIEYNAYQWVFQPDKNVINFDDPFYMAYICSYCLWHGKDHGLWATNKEILICPGTWIVTTSEGHSFPVWDEEFNEKYEII